MKGFRHQSKDYSKKALSDNLILKSLPYGKWTTTNGEEYLFNRDYEPIQGWNLILNMSIPVTSHMWIHDIIPEKTELYYGADIEYPTKDEKTFRKCWDILADWSYRMNSYKNNYSSAQTSQENITENPKPANKIDLQSSSTPLPIQDDI